MFCTLFLVAVALYRFGLPLTLYTWVVVTLAAASGITLARSGKSASFGFPVALAFCAYLAVPGPFQVVPVIQKWSLFDDAGGRSAWAITPGLRFGKDGPNTAILESHVGPLEPRWRFQAPHSPYIRDGNERVQSRNIIRHESFPEVLVMLPNDDARRAVIEALTDTENRLRVHQSLLLTCLYDLSFPVGTDRNSWWSHHKHLFYPEHDPTIAASLTQDWLEKVRAIYSADDVPSMIRVQCHAVHNQQHGAWGGHRDFGEAFARVAIGQNEPNARSRKPLGHVVWWPARHASGNAGDGASR